MMKKKIIEKSRDMWKKKDVKTLISIVKQLNIEIPPTSLNPQWQNIDKFLKKPAGSSIRKLRKLLRKYLTEAAKPSTRWEFFKATSDLIPVKTEEEPVAQFDETTHLNLYNSAAHSSSLFNLSSVSQSASFPPYQDNDMDLIFLVTQVLPDIKQLDRKSKSLFKLNVQTLIHNLKFGDF